MYVLVEVESLLCTSGNKECRRKQTQMSRYSTEYSSRREYQNVVEKWHQRGGDESITVPGGKGPSQFSLRSRDHVLQISGIGEVKQKSSET